MVFPIAVLGYVAGAAVVSGLSGLVGYAAAGGFKGPPTQHNPSHEVIKKMEELHEQHKAELERKDRENRELQDRIKREEDQKAQDALKQAKDKEWEEKKRHEDAMAKATERREDAMAKANEAEKKLKEEQERSKREQGEASDRHKKEMKEATEEKERQEAAARKAEEEVKAEKLRHEQEKQRLEEESKAKLAAQEAEAERKLQEQEAEARRQTEELKRKQAELESKYMAGIQPEVWPTPEERRRAEGQLLQPAGEHLHCAIAGLAGSGKSSLINALRGLRNHSANPAVAPTGVTETTMKITPYRDPATDPPRSRFVWYDVPGAGTIKIKGWQYFNSQGLFVFDIIVVVVDNRFSEQDLIILQHCERYKIPSFIVRSKANQHILNTMRQGYGWEDSDDERDFNDVYSEAREKVIYQTRANYRENLREGGLNPDKPVYIVSCDALASLVLEEKRKLRKENQLIDEPQFLHACLEAVKERRFQGQSS